MDNKMQLHQQRVVEEKDELQTKLIALQRFICQNSTFETLPDDEKKRLRNQAEVMDEYSDILMERIGAFNNTDHS